MPTSELKQVLSDIEVTKRWRSQNKELIWLAEQWDNKRSKCFFEDIDNSLKLGNVVYDERNLLVKVEESEDLGIMKDIAIKKFRLTRSYDKLRFRFLDSKAVRSLKISVILNEVGINIPKPVAVVERRDKFNKIISSYFITEYIDYDFSLLEIINDSQHRFREKVIDLLPDIALDVRKMHDEGVVHNDLHAGNILIKDIESNPTFYYIDLNRARIKKDINKGMRMKDLSRFKLEEAEQEVFLKSYEPNKYKQWLSLMRDKRRSRERFRHLKGKLRELLKLR